MGAASSTPPIVAASDDSVDKYEAPLGMDLAAIGPIATLSHGSIANESVGGGLSGSNSSGGGGSNGSGGGGSNGSGGGGRSLAALNSISAPKPTATSIVNMQAAIVLGKSLFWDMQVGGDGKQACASCHFQAGADNRVKNTINPGPDGIFQAVSGPGALFAIQNITSDDRVGSNGVKKSVFSSIDPNIDHAADICVADNSAAPFLNQRQVTGRNTPSAVGAVYFLDNFWDGRANHNFNGNDPFGATGNAGTVGLVIGNSSLASQAVGPANNPVELSCAGRGFNGENSLGAKLLVRKALALQTVSKTDSVLGAFSALPAKGLKCGSSACTYKDLVTAAFGAAATASAKNNFSLIWGEAVQAYESTLIPDKTPYDSYLSGNSKALTPNQVKGLDVFKGKGGCTNCHNGPELSDATVSAYAALGATNEDGGDQGFHNIGVRPTSEDLGRAGTGPNGVSWAAIVSAKNRGAFKTPSLRNVALTAPYFHNGGKATLGDVVDFYNRGGDFANPEKSKRIKALSFNDSDRSALIDFLQNALTDCRTANSMAPFDHPSLDLDNGVNLTAYGMKGTGSICQ